MLFKVRFERSPQDVGQPDLERGVGLGVVLAEGDDPGRPFSEEGPFEDEIGEIAPAQRDQREEADQKAVAMGDRGVEPDEVLGRSDQFEPEVDQFVRQAQIGLVARGPMTGANLRRQSR